MRIPDRFKTNHYFELQMAIAFYNNRDDDFRETQAIQHSGDILADLKYEYAEYLAQEKSAGVRGI